MSETIIDLRFVAETQPSLCIPRVFNNITESKIRQVFDELGLGKLSRIDIKERKNEKGETFKRVYIHFDKWFWNEAAQSARRKLVSGKEIKIVYDNPWFWKVSASKWSPASESQNKSSLHPQRSRYNIEFEEQEPRNRVKDEVCRDLRQKRDYGIDKRDFREKRNVDNYKPENRRRDTRNVNRNFEEKRTIAPSLSCIAPTLPCKINIPIQSLEKKVPRSPSSSPPKDLEMPIYEDELNNALMFEDEIVVEEVNIDYGNITRPPHKKLKKCVNKRSFDLVMKKEEDIGMSEEDKKACEQLYGDIM